MTTTALRPGRKASTPQGVEGPGFGALVLSLDFELHWGVRDWSPPGGSYTRNLFGAREAVPMMLRMFEEFDVAASWATVGLLFAETRSDFDRFRPPVLPAYADPSLSPYEEPVGEGESDDPLHYARSLVEMIKRTPRQEVASHTYSHYYCGERGQDETAFLADVRSAVGIARELGVELRSLAFPRNQVNVEYAELLRRNGFSAYRGTQGGWLYRSPAMEGFGTVARVTRLLDSYLNIGGCPVPEWHQLRNVAGLCEIPASRFLRPYMPQLRHLEPLRMRRISNGMAKAAKSNGIFHLWWHPHNFGINIEENLAALRTVLDRFSRLRRDHGMRSMTMSEVAAQAGFHEPEPPSASTSPS